MNQEKYIQIKKSIPENIDFIVVSKMQEISKVKEIYNLGHRDFAENRVQDLILKYNELEKDINWHLIGHLQTNKVKQIIGFVKMIQSLDSSKLMNEIQKQASKNNLNIDCLLQVKVAQEDSKFGLSEDELNNLIDEYSTGNFGNINIKGIMGMGSLTSNQNQIKEEFIQIKNIFLKVKQKLNNISIISMGMSNDYKLAIESGSNMVRLGSIIFN